MGVALAVAVSVLGPPLPGGSPVAAAPVRPQGYVLPQAMDAINVANQYRAQYGLAPLSIDDRLTYAATSHSRYQASINRMTHVGYGGTNAGQRILAANYTWAAWGENVAVNYHSGATVVQAWMNSPAHRANILNARFTQIGVAWAPAANGYPYWTMVLVRHT